MPFVPNQQVFTYSDTTVAHGMTYFYQLKMVSGPMESPYSNVAQVTMPA